MISSISLIKNKEWEGFEIKTTTQTISLVVDTMQRCCEYWGAELYSTEHKKWETNRDLFIGAWVAGVGFSNRLLHGQEETKNEDFSFAAVNVQTSKGVLQLVV